MRAKGSGGWPFHPVRIPSTMHRFLLLYFQRLILLSDYTASHTGQWALREQSPCLICVHWCEVVCAYHMLDM